MLTTYRFTGLLLFTALLILGGCATNAEITYAWKADNIDERRGGADEVCGEVQSKAASEVRQKLKCYENALNRAIHEAGKEGLASLHQG